MKNSLKIVLAAAAVATAAVLAVGCGSTGTSSDPQHSKQPAPAFTPAAASEPEVKESSETADQRNARETAESYLDYSAFSREGLIHQLEYEGYSHADAIYGVDAVSPDWYEQAAKSAKSYLEYSSFSRSSLVEQLEYEGFTRAQAEYGVQRAY
jgi:hypothetical protein